MISTKNNNVPTIVLQFFVAQIFFLIDSWFYFLKTTAEHTVFTDYAPNAPSLLYVLKQFASLQSTTYTKTISVN